MLSSGCLIIGNDNDNYSIIVSNFTAFVFTAMKFHRVIPSIFIFLANYEILEVKLEG